MAVRGDVPILTYHSLDPSGSPISTSPRTFRRQMAHLYQNSWRSLTLDELLAGYSSSFWPERAFALTFDDGFQNFFDEGLPVLADYGFTATLFVIPAWVGRTNEWPGQPGGMPRLALLRWDLLREAAEQNIEIGGHSLSHARLTRLPAERARQEILDCRNAIEDQIGRPVRAFAYPYGDSTPSLRDLVARHFSAGFGTRLAFASSHSSLASLDRVDSYYLGSPFFFQALDLGWLRAYLALRRWIRQARHLEAASW